MLFCYVLKHVLKQEQAIAKKLAIKDLINDQEAYSLDLAMEKEEDLTKKAGVYRDDNRFKKV